MLETNSDGATKNAERVPETGIVGGGFKGFNRTGREDTTHEILRPTIDPTTRMRYSALIAVVLVLLAGVGYLAFRRSGLTFEAPQESSKAFAPQAQSGE